MRISRSLFPLLAAGILGLALAGCGPSQSQLDAQSTQAALEIYTTQTQAAEYQHATQTAATPSPMATETPTLTPTPTPTTPASATPLPAAPGLYRSRRFPFSIEYPADWVRLPNQPGITVGYGNLETGVGIYIAEEDFNEIGFGEASLRDYVDIILYIMSATEGFELISDEQMTNANGLPVEVLDFRLGPDGSLHGQRMVYVYQDKIGFSASYLAFEENFVRLQPTIEASFDSFIVTE